MGNITQEKQMQTHFYNNLIKYKNYGCRTHLNYSASDYFKFE